MAAAGIKWDLPPAGFAWLDVKYQVGLNQMKTNADALFANTDITSKYYYKSDKFSLNNIGFTLGSAIHFINRKKNKLSNEI